MAQNFQLIISCISLLFLLCLVPSNSENPTTKKPQPFESLKHLKGCKKGDNLAGVRELKHYLNKFGYLNYQSRKAQDDDDFDDFLEAAMKMYQSNYNLKVTGTLDSETISQMMIPRCGVPDIINGTNSMLTNKKKHRKEFHTVSHYSFFQGSPKWPAGKTRLTYWFDGTMPTNGKPAFVRSFNKWASITQYFTFSETQDSRTADIKIGFARGDHGDGNPFDGRGRTLAHAFSPTDGRLHCDADELWSIGPLANYNDLETVALHEIGHLLGLHHSSVENAVMYPSIPTGTAKGLHADDVQGIKALYNL